MMSRRTRRAAAVFFVAGVARALASCVVQAHPVASTPTTVVAQPASTGGNTVVVQPAESEPVPVAQPVATGGNTVVVADAERPDHQCGPAFGGARCGAGRCCSRFNWCGSAHEDHCNSARGYGGQFDGPPAAPSM